MPETIKRPKLDLTPFCLEYGARYQIDEPWTNGTYAYATDGRILIRVDAELCPGARAAGSLRLPKDCDNIVDGRENVNAWFPVPPVVPCDRCQSVGQYVQICDTCNGSGWTLDDGRLNRCLHGDEDDGPDEECEALQVWRCHDCKIEFANSLLAQWYVNLVRSLPDARIGVASGEPDVPVYFRFGGGCGAIMPISRD
jgi:hypothetical protein